MIQYGLGAYHELIIDSVSRGLVDEDPLAGELFRKMKGLVKTERLNATPEELKIDTATFWIGRNRDAAACYNQLDDRLLVLTAEHMAALHNSRTPQERRDEMRNDLRQEGRRGLFRKFKDFPI